MIISKEVAKLLQDNEGYVDIKGHGKIHIRNFPIESDDYLSRGQKPKLTDNDQNALVVLRDVRDKLFFPILLKQDNRKLMNSVCKIDNLIKKTLETFKD